MKVTRTLEICVACECLTDAVEWQSASGELILKVNGSYAFMSIGDLDNVLEGLVALRDELNKETLANG